MHNCLSVSRRSAVKILASLPLAFACPSLFASATRSNSLKIPMSRIIDFRKLTGAPLLMCKQVLRKTDGDVFMASAVIVELRHGVVNDLRNRSTLAYRIHAALGDGENAGIVEIATETDFAARTDIGNSLVRLLAAESASGHPSIDLSSAFEDAAFRLYENVTVQRTQKFDLEQHGFFGVYNHFTGGLSAVVTLRASSAPSKKDKKLAALIAMTIASSPMLNAGEGVYVSAEVINSERDRIRAELTHSDKPPEIIGKIINGKIKKFIRERSLGEQLLVPNRNHSVLDELKRANLEIIKYVRWERIQAGGCDSPRCI